jgi:hypothetical protein
MTPLVRRQENGRDFPEASILHCTQWIYAARKVVGNESPCKSSWPYLTAMSMSIFDLIQTTPSRFAGGSSIRGLNAGGPQPA